MQKRFQNKSKKNYKEPNPEEASQVVVRVRLPRGERETIGIIEERFGGNKMRVSCLDGKERNCRVPGRLRRKLWLRPGDVIIVEPWEFDNNKGDIVFKYTPAQIQWLRNKGFLKAEDNEF